MDTLTQCRHLTTLVLEVQTISVQSINKLLTSVKSLLLFYVCMKFEGKRTQKSNRKARLFAKSLAEVIKLEEGRAVDFQVFADTCYMPKVHLKLFPLQITNAWSS